MLKAKKVKPGTEAESLFSERNMSEITRAQNITHVQILAGTLALRVGFSRKSWRSVQ